ncbi:DUF1311 domain-containing protein [Ochrobactrum sp. Marseille-Q0166]|nr:DUF1311 domain-containing protein [Ochrobactrum sp. Marseille-Q0166]
MHLWKKNLLFSRPRNSLVQTNGERVDAVKYSAVLSLALGISALAPMTAFAQAGFDCGKASTKTEKAICSHSEIAEADRAMSIAYAALIDRSDSGLKEALREDQTAFLKQRSEAFESHLSNPEMRLEGLHYRTEQRAELFNWISVTNGSSLEGNWQNAWGSIKVEKKSPTQLAVNIDVADQANGSWVCSFEGTVQLKSAGEAVYQGEGGPLTLKLDGAVLKVPTPFCDASTSGGYGSAAGTYFRVGA